ncbi:MAG: 50S ribosomal protein L11 methyltransferase [Myxococcota bacterium]|nr:50S ribosomal protein L11 methyltransferase [Myxococcota bacterium]
MLLMSSGSNESQAESQEWWWQATLQVPDSLADDFAGMLFEFGAEGVELQDDPKKLPTFPTSTKRPRAAQAIPSPVCGTTHLIAHFPADYQLESIQSAIAQTLALFQPAPIVEVINILARRDQTWRETWKQFFKPLQITPSLWVLPPWEQRPADTTAQLILIDPGMAFGTGQHETTQLVLSTLWQYLPQDQQRNTHKNLLDVGCGSGILAIASAMKGIGAVEAIDIDPESIAATLTNAAINHIAHKIHVSTTPVGDITTRFDWVVANIIAPTLIQLAPDIVARIKPGGHLLLSGLLTEQAAEVEEVYRKAVEAKLGSCPTPIRTPLGQWQSLYYSFSSGPES